MQLSASLSRRVEANSQLIDKSELPVTKFIKKGRS